jgi:hypothetical protein
VTTRLLRTYLAPTAITSFKVGCCVEGFLRRFSRTTPHPLPAIRPIPLHATNDESGPIRFDSDSFAVGVNNHALYCMINSPHLFENLTLTGNTRQVNGISTGLAIEGKGTFKFSITDNNGQRHTIHIPNSLYIPKLEKCLLLPQHWAQEEGDNQTWMGNFAHCCILYWGKGFQKTVLFDSTSNTLTFFTASSSKVYRTFTSTYKAHKASFFRRKTVLTTQAAADNQAKLMHWHYRLGHLSFPKLKQLALNGKIPKNLSKVKPPTCAGCLFGAMTKNPWRGKESKSSHEVFVATKPGETVSCD